MKRKIFPHKRAIPAGEQGIILVAVILILAVLLLLGGAAVMNTGIHLRMAGKSRSGEQASRIAEAGIEHTKRILRGMATDALLLGSDGLPNTADDGIPSFGSTVNFAQGNYRVVVTDNDDGDGNLVHDSDGMVTVVSTGTTADGIIRVITAVLLKPNPQTTNIRGSVTANAGVGALGNMEIDGRDHDLNGIFTASGLGKMGVSTSGMLDTGGNASIGGSTAANPQVDIAPVKSGYQNIIQEHATWTPPVTPDQVLVLPVGTLKSIAQKSVSGSQYVTDPSQLHSPFSGVTYVELPAGVSWNGDGMANGSGILIVHNATTNSSLKNLSAGPFRGLLIGDDIVHVNNTIIGGMVNLTSAPADTLSLGTGGGRILYSSAAIDAALTVVSDTILVISWKETL